MSQLICYCFEHTETDIRSDVVEHNGQSEILTKILAAKKQGTCQCAEKHPEAR
ncbi:MAG: BFD-like (2Fe-2S) protein [Deltaproteobacteria bacterium]|nr:MAG: BFD-like (2Fe-2S) protein [Deltaproteobacteria bacterium]